MKVSELIDRLAEFNPDARIAPLAHNQEQPFSLCWGGAEGAGKADCAEVYLACDALNKDEQGQAHKTQLTSLGLVQRTVR